jgi:hypothetical protein
MDPVCALAASPYAEKGVYAATPGMVWELDFAGRIPALPRLPVTPWKKSWRRGKKLWIGKKEEEKEMVEEAKLAIKAYNGLLWGLHNQRPPRRVYRGYT